MLIGYACNLLAIDAVAGRIHMSDDGGRADL